MILGIDVGGTFTDIVLLDSQQLKLQYKTPTTEDIFSGVLDALDFIFFYKVLPPNKSNS